MRNKKMAVGIIGGGPAGLFMFKKLLQIAPAGSTVDIFESSARLGCGMPYSRKGANKEHVTNVSDNEIPELFMPIAEWVKIADPALLKEYNITPENFNEYKVLPRLFFGEYLSAQFDLLLKEAAEKNIDVAVHLNSPVLDVSDRPADNCTMIKTADKTFSFDRVIICTGHVWPLQHEEIIKGWFDSPYPPEKLQLQVNHAVGIKGASLTAIDAIRTLARCNGKFSCDDKGEMSYTVDEESKGFNIVMHSISGLLPAVRFHLEDTHLKNDDLLTRQDIKEHIAKNNGFLSLDFIFEKDFKEIFRDKDPQLYRRIKDQTIEEFVTAIMAHRENKDAFELLQREYDEAERSIRKEESIYWKEMLGVLSFAMNYPAKYLSAEDMLRLKKVMMPLISVVIAYVPQSSCKELLALHAAGVLQLIGVGPESYITPDEKEGAVYHYDKETETRFRTFVNAAGQPPLSFKDFPFKSLIDEGAVTPAVLKFRHFNPADQLIDKKTVIAAGDHHYLEVPGVAIDDHFRVIGKDREANQRIFIMAVPFIGGYNPDYSGLDFCEEASGRIGEVIFCDIS